MSRFSLNQASIKYATVPEAIAATVGAGIPGIGLWREPVAEFGLAESAALVRDAGLRVSSLCRGGFFTQPDWRDENLRAIEEAAALGAPTQYYKTGVAFLSWLNGHQPSFTMVGGLHSARSIPHLAEIVRLADAAGALERPELAAQRWNDLLAVNGL